MEFAYSELTQKVNLLKGGFVGEGVIVGFGVAVKVIVGVKGIVGVIVGLALGRSVSGVKLTGKGLTVTVGVTGGVSASLNTKISTRTTPMIMGTPNLRSAGGRDKVDFPDVGATGGSPVYPNAASRLLRLSTYSPDVKLT